MAIYNLKQLTILTIIFSILFLALPASADTACETNVISKTGIDAQGGKISGDYIVYLGTEGFNQSMNRIHLYSIKTGENKIIGTPDPGMTVTGQDISGDYAVWFETPSIDYENGDNEKPNSIYLYSIGNGLAKVLELPGNAEWPKIHGEKIVYPVDPESSGTTSIFLYDIESGKSEKLTEISQEADTAGIVFDGNNLGWQDGEGLYIYNIGSGERTTAFRSVYGNESGSNLGSFDLDGDYLIYLKHTVNREGPDKGMYDQPSLYTLSTGETKLIDPKTGEIVSAMSAGEMKLSITSPFTDGKRVGWAYSDNSPDSTIVLLDPATGVSSIIPVKGSANQIFMDNNQIIWTESHFPSFASQLVYAEEKETTGNEAKASAPGFTAFCCITALAAAVFIMAKRR